MPNTVEVLITIPLAEHLIQRLTSVSPRLHLTVLHIRRVDEIPPEIWQQTEVLYTARLLPLTEQVPNLRWVQFHWAGVDHALDAPLLRTPNLLVSTLSGVASPQMAEFALMMILALGHHMPDMLAHQKRGEWPKDRWTRFSPHELRGSTVGIVGYGSIGRQIARLLHEFGANVLATKRDVMHPEDHGYTPDGLGDPSGDYIHRLYPPQAMISMLEECDYVVFTVPLTTETRNLIGAKELAALKPTAYLVDISRGNVINHEALYNALHDQKIAGAALDVFPEEPIPPDHPLWKLPNVILTPHISGNTPHYDERAVAMFSENLHRYLSGLPLYNLVDLERGY
jgi:phosphoglycerate dehydrogenase-like enzyme